ncbi:anti-anti-sigma factor [Acidovorax carolinensis]|uniref:Anti-anti-sigma factor n=1 Tax=Acidovorax carolinensis TaxID=553814 RepID=A0A240UFM1_9BURK|nr:RseA family anti-sigma factor [Acidovorax carolinensis]ART54497.1 anti-anti-sigma factor [Acidovorax carolinensis]ART59852.1 anti-anti-sigma factor [Acidovorax carolinensis]
MNTDLMQREQLSALADGQLQGDELAQALQFAAQDDGQSTWQLYHLVGDVLRSPELALHQHGNHSMVMRIREQLAHEPMPGRLPDTAPAVAQIARPETAVAANASVFRWKMAAGFASLAAVAAIGWSSFAGLQGAEPSGAQLAVAPAPAQPAAPVVTVAGNEGQQQVMIRDPRLDELLAAHKQFGSTSALQMPAGFLRNATFETPDR